MRINPLSGKLSALVFRLILDFPTQGSKWKSSSTQNRTYSPWDMQKGSPNDAGVVTFLNSSDYKRSPSYVFRFGSIIVETCEGGKA